MTTVEPPIKDPPSRGHNSNNLSTKDKNGWPQHVLCLEVPLYIYLLIINLMFTLYSVYFYHSLLTFYLYYLYNVLQVFGGLLNQPIKEGEDETDSGGEEGTDAEPSSMANILFNKSSLSGLQRSVCQHVMVSVHSEAEKMKIEWEASIKESQSLSSKPAVTNRQSSHDPGLEGKTKGGATDTYCYELLTMLSGLSQTELGCTFLAEHSQLVKDLVSLLHTASSRIQHKVQYMCMYIVLSDTRLLNESLNKHITAGRLLYCTVPSGHFLEYQ